MTARSVLVTGGAGWVGSALLPRLRSDGGNVLAPSRAELDVSDAAAVEAWMAAHRPEAVVHLAAARPSASAAELEGVNHVGARAIASAASRVGARLVHVSSDVVFDGRHAPYDEDAAPSPVTPYGRSKAEGEAAALAAHEDVVSVRTSLSWDPALINRGTAGFASRLARGEPCRLFTDEIRCPLPRAVLAECLVRLIDHPWRGPLHVAGREALSRHAFGTLLLEHFGVEGRDAVEAVRAADLEAAGAPPRPRDLRLRIDGAQDALGLRLPGVRDQLS